MSIFEQRESDIRAYCRVYPVVFDKAENARQTDENGKEYIDFFAGAGVLNFGHNNERMTKAIVEYIQSKGGIFYFVRRVPVDVQPYYSSKRVSFSLKSQNSMMHLPRMCLRKR